MTRLFQKLFIKDYQKVSDPEVRSRYGRASGILGIVANAFLFIIKLIGALLSGSVAVIADAINNLTDFLTSIITMIGFKISGKPADKDHPFGHARFEYVTALLIACVIFFIGFETARASIDKIFSLDETKFSIITCVILGASVIVKIFLAIIMKGLGKAIDSEAILAMSADSRNDSISTSVVLICAVISLISGVSLDGYLGVLVSIFVLISAITLIKETIDPLLGEKADEDLIKSIERKILSYDGILGIHELVVHCYGPTQFFASVHIEVDSRVDVMISHELADTIERDCLKDLNVNLVCHLDPLNLSDPETVKLNEIISSCIKKDFPEITIHDLRIVKGPSFTNVIFDAVLPYDKDELAEPFKQEISKLLNGLDGKYFAVIEFEKRF